MATKKEELSKWRNLTKGNLIKRQEAINNLLSSLPNDVQALTDTEKNELLRIRHAYNTILSKWDYNSSSLIAKTTNSY